MRRQLIGTIIKISSKNTVAVRVDRVAMHPKYHKRYKISRKYLVHDPESTAKVGQVVSIKETRPISRMKRWIIVPETKN